MKKRCYLSFINYSHFGDIHEILQNKIIKINIIIIFFLNKIRVSNNMDIDKISETI